MEVRFIRKNLRLAVACLLLFLLAACRSSTPEPVPTQTPAEPTIPAPTSSPTSLPSPTPKPAMIVLLAPEGSDPGLVELLTPVFAAAAQNGGVQFETRQSLGVADLTPELRLVAAIPPDPGLANLAQVAPGAQFLAIQIPNLQTGTNLSLIGGQGERPDQQGFLAGYIAAMITTDWRVGVIGVVDTPAGKAARQGFINGVVYYCGLCRPSYPPYYQFPLTADITSEAGEAEQQAAADALISQSIKTIFVTPGADGPFLLEYLARKEVGVIAGVTPPAGTEGQWVVTLQSDLVPLVAETLPRLLNGESGLNLPLPLALMVPNDQLFSPGRQVMAMELLDEMLAGFTDSGVDPQTGELK